MRAETILHPAHGAQLRNALSARPRPATGAIRTIRARLSQIAETCSNWLFAMEPWHFETLDMPEFRPRSSAAETSASTVRVGPASRPERRLTRYRATIMNAQGAGERTFTFDDSATLLEKPINIAARTILDHIVEADQPADPLSYRITESARHGDILMLKGMLPTGRGELEFIVAVFPD
jgi:hypothetical protein